MFLFQCICLQRRERELWEIVWFSLASLLRWKMSNGFLLAASFLVVPLLPPHLGGCFIQSGNRTQNNRHADITNSQSLKVDSRWIFHVCFVLRKTFFVSFLFCCLLIVRPLRPMQSIPIFASFFFCLLLLNIVNCFVYNCTFGQDIHEMWNFQMRYFFLPLHFFFSSFVLHCHVSSFRTKISYFF